MGLYKRKNVIQRLSLCRMFVYIIFNLKHLETVATRSVIFCTQVGTFYAMSSNLETVFLSLKHILVWRLRLLCVVSN